MINYFIDDGNKTTKQIRSSNLNNNVCVGGMDYLQIGSGDDGPAIYLKDSLQDGQVNCSETFKNELLTSNNSNLKTNSCSLNTFKVQNIEVILL